MLCIRPAVCIDTPMLCIRPAYLTLTLTLTLPGRMQTSVHCCMAIALNRSFCFSILSVSNTWCDLSKYTAASFSKSCQIAMQFAFFLSKISSSAVAKRPRDASCLSVVSFNSTKRGVESFLVSYALWIYHCVQLNALFCCLWHNVEASCHKHFVVFSGKTPRAYYQRCVITSGMLAWPCSTGDSADNAWLVAALTAGTKVRYRLRNAISAYHTCIWRSLYFPSEYRQPVWYEKNYNGVATRWWKKFDDMFIRFDIIHECDRHTDRRTDRQTPHDGTGRAYA